MWIIPKNSSIYRSAQDTEALISDLQELSELCAQSLLWRSKPSQSSTWSRRLKPGTLMSALFSQTLKPSHGSSIVGEWISSQEASLVNHLAQPVDEQETATLDTCGPTLPTGLDAWNTLPLFSWKTSRGSSAASSQAQNGQTQRARPFSCMSLESWRGWVTKRRREYSQRAKSVRLISESEYSFWVVAPISARQGEGSLIGCSEGQSGGKRWLTPCAAHAGKDAQTVGTYLRRQKIGKQVSLAGTILLDLYGPHQEAQSSTHGSHQESRWATPQARDWKGAQGRAYKGESLDLPAQAWATPKTRDYKDASMTRPPIPRKDGKQRMDDLPAQIHAQEAQWATPTSRDYKGRQPPNNKARGYGDLLPDQQQYSGKLNPRWVETLMGLPVGWVMPSCVNLWTIEQMSCDCSEMGLSPQQQSEHSECCGKTCERDE